MDTHASHLIVGDIELLLGADKGESVIALSVLHGIVIGDGDTDLVEGLELDVHGVCCLGLCVVFYPKGNL
ncbi:MAG: hypothetical protein EBU90_01310 [Proteobacteria bacterium]|nr:hypothetical protein [Pseudomonadota bacterium]NBP12799.1 hypothetical protein [bacterium]